MYPPGYPARLSSMTEQTTQPMPQPHDHTAHAETQPARSYGPGVQAELRMPSRDLRRAIPDTYAAFAALHSAALAEGVLSTKIKELIALALSVGEQCDGCIASHARGAAKAGATEAEVAEAIGVTLLMVGGPATVYGPRAFAAFREFAAQ